jgi:hypothetical protein
MGCAQAPFAQYATGLPAKPGLHVAVQALPAELVVDKLQPSHFVAFAGRAGVPMQPLSVAPFFRQLPNAFPHAPREHVARREPT